MMSPLTRVVPAVLAVALAACGSVTTVTRTVYVTAPPARASATTPASQPSTQPSAAATGSCVLDSTNFGATTWAVSAGLPCPDAQLVQLLAYNTGNPWDVTASAPPQLTPTCALTDAGATITVTASDGPQDSMARSACSALETGGWVPA